VANKTESAAYNYNDEADNAAGSMISRAYVRTYNEAACFPPSPLGPEHRVPVEVHRAVLRVLIVVASARLQPLRHEVGGGVT
jgi:hypothetical protein